MSELKTKNGDAFIRWGIFLLIFPAIAGAIFCLLLGLFDVGQFDVQTIAGVIIISYWLWGWVSVIAGAILIVKGNQRKSNAAKLAQPQDEQPTTEQ